MIHSFFTFLHLLPPPPDKEQDEQDVEGQQDDSYDSDSQDDDQRHIVGSQVFSYQWCSCNKYLFKLNYKSDGFLVLNRP